MINIKPEERFSLVPFTKQGLELLTLRIQRVLREMEEEGKIFDGCPKFTIERRGVRGEVGFGVECDIRWETLPRVMAGCEEELQDRIHRCLFA